MTAKQLAQYHGKHAMLEVSTGSPKAPALIQVEVVITDASWNFARLDLTFTPVAGSGEGRASLEKLTFIQTK